MYRQRWMSVWDKPRVIGCAENYPRHIALPRGCLDAALSLLRENGIACDLRDVISAGDHVIVTGEVRALESREGDPLVFHAGDYRPLT